jgi:hypothetical protein
MGDTFIVFICLMIVKSSCYRGPNPFGHYFFFWVVVVLSDKNFLRFL